MRSGLRIVILFLTAVCAQSAWSQSNPRVTTDLHQILGTELGSPACESLRRRSPEFERLAEVCEYALGTPRALPNFVCTETVEQYLAPEAKPRIITTELTIQQGESRYANVTLDGKPQTDEYKSSDFLFEELVGSTGEFAMLFHVFSASNQADFSPPVDSVLNRARVKHYEFRVKRENNTAWTWYFPNYKLNPGFHGSISVDAASGKISQLILQVGQGEVDPQIPVSESTTTVDYGDIPIAEAGTYHLPIRGQNVSCFPILNGCIRADLKFGNFHKFGSTVRILPATQ